jgi:hypothetical protein
MRFRNRRFRVATVFVFGVAILAFVSGAWAVFGEGTAPATFSVVLDGDLVSTAKGYGLDAAIVNANKREQYKEYTLRISLQLKDNPAPAEAFQNGQTFASAKINLLSAGSAILKTYELVNATVVAYRQSGNAATNSFDQELVLKSRTLTISGP